MKPVRGQSEILGREERKGRNIGRIHAKERGCCEASWEVKDLKEGGVGGGEEEVSWDTIEVFTHT